MVFRKKNIAMIQSKHCDELIETMRWFKPNNAMFNINHRIVFMLLHSRCDVPSVYIQIVFCKHAAYVPQTLALSNRIVFKVIVLLKVNHAASGYG